MTPKEPIRFLGDHLKANPRRQYGPQSGRLVPCAVKPDIHGFYPENENCPGCRSWLEQLDEKRDTKTEKDLTPVVKAERTPGRRLFDYYGRQNGRSSEEIEERWARASLVYWDEQAAYELAQRGPAWFDATYP